MGLQRCCGAAAPMLPNPYQYFMRLDSPRDHKKRGSRNGRVDRAHDAARRELHAHLAIEILRQAALDKPGAEAPALRGSDGRTALFLPAEPQDPSAVSAVELPGDLDLPDVAGQGPV